MTKGFLLVFIFLLPIVVVTARKTRLTWVNGVGYSLKHMEEGKQWISDVFGGKEVLYCHNPTSKAHDDDTIGYIGDLTQAGTQKLGRATEEVNALVQHLKESVAKVGKKGRVIHIAHSQGALITSLAAKQLTPLEMNRIEVLAFGGAVALRKTPQTPFARVVNYYSINDPLLLLVPSAAQALRSGFVGDEEFCFLAPRIGDPIGDHNLMGPTYATAMKWEGKRFKQTYQPIMYRTLRPSFLFLLALLQTISERLHVLLKFLLRPIIRTLVLLKPYTQQAKSFLVSHVLKPIVTCIVFFCAWIEELIRRLKGEERYFPAQVAIDQAKQD